MAATSALSLGSLATSCWMPPDGFIWNAWLEFWALKGVAGAACWRAGGAATADRKTRQRNANSTPRLWVLDLYMFLLPMKMLDLQPYVDDQMLPQDLAGRLAPPLTPPPPPTANNFFCRAPGK